MEKENKFSKTIIAYKLLILFIVTILIGLGLILTGFLLNN